MAKITREEALAEIARRKQMREQQAQPEETQGLAGVGNDVMSSLASAPEAAEKMVRSIPGGVKNVYNYATSNSPLETLANLGAGGVESGAGLLSAAPKLARYLAEKFPGYGELLNKGRALRGQKSIQETPTLHESLMNFEKNHGLGAQSEEEGSVRNLGGLLFGGKGLTKLPNMGSRVAALAAQQGGEGGDPLHAAILGLLGEKAAKGTLKGSGVAVNAVKAIPEVAKNLPEYSKKAAGSALESVADYGSKVPMVGPIIQPTLGALGAHLKYTSVLPEEMAQRKLFGDITSEHLPLIQERSAAANRLGFNITPAEASLSPFEARKQGTIGRTREGEKLLFEKGRERSSKEETSINTLLDNIYDEDKLAPEKKAAYRKTMENDVPPEFVEKYSKNPLITDVIKKMDSDPIYKTGLEGVKKNSFEYWDHVKRILGDIGEREKELGRATYGSDVAAKARRSMVDEMDKIAPDYKNARKISERNFVRNDIENFFDKRKMTGNNFAKLLNSEKKYNGLLSKLEPYPEAVQNLKDMKMVFGDLIPTDPSIRTAAAMEKTSMWNARNKLDALKQALDQKHGEKHDVATVKLMTDPMWQSLLADYLRKHGR